MSEPTSQSSGIPRREADPPSLPKPPDAKGQLDATDAQKLDRWLIKLHESVSELARGQRELHARVGALTERLEAGREAGAADVQSGRSVPHQALDIPDPPAHGLVYRVGRAGVGLLRKVRHGLAAVKNSSRPLSSIIRAPIDLPPDNLRLALVLLIQDRVSGDTEKILQSVAPWQLPELTEVVLWNVQSGDYQFFDASENLISSGQASSLASLMAASTGEVCVSLRSEELRDWSAGALAAALCAFCIEDLKFVEVVKGARRLLLSQWTWRASPHALDPARFAECAGHVVGRSMVLQGSSALPPLPSGADSTTRSIANQWIAGGRTPRPVRHARRLRVDLDPTAHVGGEVSAVVLTHPLDSGVERLVAALATAQPSSVPLRILQLADQGPEPAHPVMSLTALTPWVVPLHLALDASDRAAAALHLFKVHGVSRILHIGTGRHFFDDPQVQSQLGNLLVALHLPTNQLDGEPAPSIPKGVRTLDDFSIDLGPAILTLPDQQAVRQHLGLPADSTVVAHVGDLGFAQRPDDIVRMAQHLVQRDDVEIVIAGRGPLAGGVDDLIAFYQLQRCHRTNAHISDVLAAADLVVSTAEHHVIPWELIEALRHGVPVVACNPKLAPWLLNSPAGPAGHLVDVAPGEDPAPQLAELVINLADDVETRRQLGANGPAVVATLSGGPIDRLWTSFLRPQVDE